MKQDLGVQPDAMTFNTASTATSQAQFWRPGGIPQLGVQNMTSNLLLHHCGLNMFKSFAATRLED